MNTPTQAPAPATPGDVITALAARLGQATQLDRGALTEDAPEVHHTAELVLELLQEFQLDTTTVEQVGPPGPHLERVADPAALQAALSQRLLQAQAEVRQALQRWADANPGTYRRLAPGQAALLNPSQGIAWPVRCQVCQGQRQQRCPSCQGQGRRPCTGCQGQGRVACTCQGRPVPCQNCNGKGRWSSHDPAWQWQNRPMVTPLSHGGAQCNACAGMGTRHCTHCQGGWTACRAGCQGGQQGCPDCQAQGHRPCPACAGRGELHALGQVRSRVRVEEGVPQITLDDEAARALLRQLDPARLPGLGQLTAVHHQVRGHALHTQHRLSMVVKRARIRVGGKVLDIHGFGPHTEILDDGGIAALLQQAEQDRLQAATRRRRTTIGLGVAAACIVLVVYLMA